jgi:hypothetical protein
MSDCFEHTLENAFDGRFQNDKFCRDLWSALANVDWYHPETHEVASYSFRAAGSLIARLRGDGDYMDWYCCGPVASVSDFIRRSLKKQGWIFDDQPSICDEPGCLEDISSGWPQEDGRYRWTCHDHIRNI